jgi:hypothetical protein
VLCRVVLLGIIIVIEPRIFSVAIFDIPFIVPVNDIVQWRLENIFESSWISLTSL